MGDRGPQPLPTALARTRGTHRPGRSAANEAQPVGKPMCPAWLNPDAKKEFRRLVRLLGDMGLLGAADGNALTRYVTTWVRWRQVTQLLEKAGVGGLVQVYRGPDGQPRAVQVSALASIARGLGDELNRLEQSFGMTPSARSRIEVAAAPSGDSDDLEI